MVMPVSPVFAVVAAISVLLWTGVLLQQVFAAEDRGRRVLLVSLLWAVALGVILVGVISSGSGHAAPDGTPQPVVLGSLQRALLASVFPLVATLSLVAVFYAVTRGLSPRSPGRELWLGFAAFVSASVLAAIFGTRPTFLPGLLVTPLLFAAVYVLPPVDPGQVLAHARRMLLGLVYLSAAAALLAPGRAFSGESRLQFLGVEERLQGVLGHPNGLGAASAFALVVALAWAGSSRGRGAHVLTCTLVLLLTDSRAAWASAVLGVLVVWLGSSAASVNPSRRSGRRGVAVVCIAAGGWLTLSGAASDGSAPMGRLTTDIENLTGRTTVWNLTVDEWRRSPIVGYGPLLWSDEYRAERYGSRFAWAGQAHNQFVHSLGATGVLGLLALLTYLGALLRSALRTRARYGGAGLALLVTLLVQMLNETPLRNHFVDPALLSHVIVFSVLLALARTEDGSLDGRMPAAARHQVGAGLGRGRSP